MLDVLKGENCVIIPVIQIRTMPARRLYFQRFLFPGEGTDRSVRLESTCMSGSESG